MQNPGTTMSMGIVYCKWTSGVSGILKKFKEALDSVVSYASDADDVRDIAFDENASNDAVE